MNTIKIKRGQSTNISTLTLEPGELAVTLDTKELYVGDENKKPIKVNSITMADTNDIVNLFSINNENTSSASQTVNEEERNEEGEEITL